MADAGLDFSQTHSVARSITCDDRLVYLNAHIIHSPPFRAQDRDFRWNRFVLLYLIRGKGTFIDGRDIEHRLRPGTLLQRLPNCRHTILRDPSEPWIEFAFVAEPEFYHHLRAVGLVDGARPVLYPGVDDLHLGRISNYFDCLGRETEQRRIVQATIDLLGGWYDLDQDHRHPSDLRLRIERACSLLAEDLAGDPDLHQVATDVGLGYHSFRKAFKSTIGMSPGEYRRRRKMDKAQRLLAACDRSIKEVAADLGYVDQGAFSRAFKAVAGVSPQAFRKQYGPEGE